MLPNPDHKARSGSSNLRMLPSQTPLIFRDARMVYPGLGTRIFDRRGHLKDRTGVDGEVSALLQGEEQQQRHRFQEQPLRRLEGDDHPATWSIRAELLESFGLL